MLPPRDQVRRFTRGQRWIHACLGTLMGACIVTAGMLYWGPLSTLVGRRELVETVHFASGLLLPAPLMVGAIASKSFRTDMHRLNRFLPGDRSWLLARNRRDGSFPSGKFNAGQKLNSAFVLGAVLTLFATGLMLHSFSLFPDNIRTGATFVHDAFAAAVVIASAGHLWMAWQDPEARRGLRTGYVSRGWAQREHALWAAEDPDDTPGNDAQGVADAEPHR
jgi:formate dehydrogenase subunit gamma